MLRGNSVYRLMRAATSEGVLGAERKSKHLVPKQGESIHQYK